MFTTVSDFISAESEANALHQSRVKLSGSTVKQPTLWNTHMYQILCENWKDQSANLQNSY
jgi:hypothetical protein